MLALVLAAAISAPQLAVPQLVLGQPFNDKSSFAYLRLTGGTLTGALKLTISGSTVVLDTTSNLLRVRNSGNTDYAPLAAGSLTLSGGGSETFIVDASADLSLASVTDVCWATDAVASHGKTTCLNQDSSGVLSIATAVSNAGNGDLKIKPSVLTAGTMTVTSAAFTRCVISRYDWTNAMVVALGAVGAGDIAVATLPAKTVVKDALVVINTPDTSANALTVAVGRTGAAYIDYIIASDAKAAANTVYGDAISGAETGTNLFDATAKWVDDRPSWTGTTVINAHFIKSVTNLSTVLGSTGSVYLETCTPP